MSGGKVKTFKRKEKCFRYDVQYAMRVSLSFGRVRHAYLEHDAGAVGSAHAGFGVTNGVVAWRPNGL